MCKEQMLGYYFVLPIGAHPTPEKDVRPTAVGYIDLSLETAVEVKRRWKAENCPIWALIGVVRLSSVSCVGQIPS